MGRTCRRRDDTGVLQVHRYFVGYPKPRVPRAPFLIAALAVVLSHPATGRMAAAAFRPIRKLPHDPVELSTAPVVPLPQARHQPHAGYVRRYPARRHSNVRIQAAGRVWQDSNGYFMPTPSMIEEMRVPLWLSVVLRLCTDSHGRVESVRLLRRSHLDDWDSLVAATIAVWWHHADAGATESLQHPGCTILTVDCK